MWKHSLSYFYYIMFLRFINCCQCNTSLTHSHPKFNKSNTTALYLEKRQLEFEDFERTTEYSFDNMTDVSTTPDLTTVNHRAKNSDDNETTTENVSSSSVSYENSTEVDYGSEVNETIEATESIYDLTDRDLPPTTTNETIIPTTEIIQRRFEKIEKQSNRELAKKCRHFKKGTAFDLAKMADVWQVVYYRLPNKLRCFKLHIKLVDRKEQLRLAKIYGNFNESVHWNKCHMEIKSSEKSEGGARRHFLQGSERDKGVMENVIIDEEHCQNTTFLTLYHESSDQWLVIKNLLVMRDCDTGDLVVFSRVPLQPRRDDILDALMVFGENKPNGTMACEDKADRTWLSYEESVISQPLK